MSKLIICRGLPASGKSTWAKQWVLEDPEHRVRINQDDIRLMLGKYWVPSREKLVQEIQFDAIIEALNREFEIKNIVQMSNGTKSQLFEALWFNLELLDAFIEVNPHLNDEKIKILTSWKKW